MLPISAAMSSLAAAYITANRAPTPRTPAAPQPAELSKASKISPDLMQHPNRETVIANSAAAYTAYMKAIREAGRGSGERRSLNDFANDPSEPSFSMAV